jgi:hypothetical protein
MVMGYINEDRNGGEGGPDEVKGNDIGPYVVPRNDQNNPLAASLGDIKLIKSNPTVSTSAYVSGDCIGEVETLENATGRAGKGTLLTGLEVKVNSNTVHPDLDILIFDEDPEDSTTTDNSAFVLHANDIDKHIATVQVSSSDYVLNGTKYSANLRNLAEVLQASSESTNLYFVIVSKGTPTFAATTDLHLLFKFMRE